MDGHVKAFDHKRLLNVVDPTQVGSEWNGKAPNLMHWDAQYHE
jgi:hypothetical protein